MRLGIFNNCRLILQIVDHLMAFQETHCKKRISSRRMGYPRFPKCLSNPFLTLHSRISEARISTFQDSKEMLCLLSMLHPSVDLLHNTKDSKNCTPRYALVQTNVVKSTRIKALPSSPFPVINLAAKNLAVLKQLKRVN